MSEELQEFMEDHGQEWAPTPEPTPDPEPTPEPEPTPDPLENIGPSSEDLADPNSDYWKGQAERQGWKDGVTGKDGYAKTAREYVNDGGFMGQIHTLKNQQEKIASQQETLLSMQRSAHEAKLAELKAQRTQAVEEADTERFNSVDQQIRQAETALSDIAPAPQPETTNNVAMNPVVQAWNQSNPWIADAANPASPNYQKAGIANQVFNNAISKGATPEQAVQIVDQTIAQRFPAQSPTRQAPTHQAPSSGAITAKAALPYSQLTRDEQRQVDTAVDNGMFTREEAVKKMNEYRQEGAR